MPKYPLRSRSSPSPERVGQARAVRCGVKVAGVAAVVEVVVVVDVVGVAVVVVVEEVGKHTIAITL